MQDHLTVVHDDVDNSELIVRQLTLARFKPADQVKSAVDAIMGTGWWRNAELCKDGGTIHVVNRKVGDACQLCGRVFAFEEVA